jgi:hypothetical protein
MSAAPRSLSPPELARLRAAAEASAQARVELALAVAAARRAGVQSVTVANLIDVSRSTLYRRYGSARELLSSALEIPELVPTNLDDISA